MDTKVQQIKEYYNHPAISQSQIKVELGIARKEKNDDNPALLKGSIFDCLVLTPSLYTKLFCEWTQSSAMPTGKVKQIVDTYYKRFPEEKELHRNTEGLVQIMDELEYNMRYKTPTRINTVVVNKNGQKYLEHLHLQGDRKLVPADLRINLYAPSELLRYHLKDQLASEHEAQKPVYFKYNGKECKGLIDLVVFNEDSIELYDIKYTELPIEDYNTEIRRRRTDIQLSFYREALQLIYDKPVTCHIAVYSKVDNTCVTIDISDLDLQIAKYGAVKDLGDIYINDSIVKHRMRIKGWVEYFEPREQDALDISSIWN